MEADSVRETTYYPKGSHTQREKGKGKGKGKGEGQGKGLGVFKLFDDVRDIFVRVGNKFKKFPKK